MYNCTLYIYHNKTKMLINIKLKQFCFRTSIVKTNYNFSYQSTLNSLASVVTQLTYKLPVPGEEVRFCCHTADIKTPPWPLEPGVTRSCF